MAFRIPFAQASWEEYLSGQEAQLPSLPAVEDVSDRVIRVLGGNPGSMQLQGTNTYLVGTGSSRILIDTGQGKPIWIRRLIKVLEGRNIDIAYVLLTHWHGDHTGGVPSLVAYDKSLSTRVYKNRPDKGSGQKNILDGQTFRVEGATIRAVFTPGHAVDHMCFLLEEENALFTGDNVLGHGYSVVEDLGAYIDSLTRMANLRCPLGYPAHGEKIVDLPSRMKEYIQHKEFRIRQVFSTLERSQMSGERQGRGRGGMTIRELVEAMYGNVPESVEKALVPFLSQALGKLAEDRKVGFEAGEPTNRRWFVSLKKG
ncbi:Putative AdaB [Aspergillus calidoustus]|uniref:Putative AdaB n=1 Tax=Aspergillus calidoustus TaxID=454130 RepID=A0A0U4YWB3_ASPCI|nr:Putative AdaB [Aspergillus calidoustus]